MSSRGSSLVDRQASFKNKGKNLEELRRRRNDASVELRKAKKEDFLSKRRNVNVDDDEIVSPEKDQNNEKAEMNTIAEIRKAIHDPQTAFQAVQTLRKLLSRVDNPPIDEVIKMGDVIPTLVKFLELGTSGGCMGNDEMQFETAWALTNIASGNSKQTMAVVDHGAIPHFIRLMSSSNSNVSEQAVWALGNIAGDGSKLRDLVIKHGIIPPLLALSMKEDITLSSLRNVVWVMSNLCRNKNPSPSFESIKKLLPRIKQLLDHTDTEIQTDVCWALSYLSDGTNEQIDLVAKVPGLAESLVRRLACGELVVVTPALRAVGNIVTGSDTQTDVILNAGSLPVVQSLLEHHKSSIVKESCWMISNITAGTPKQIDLVIESGVLNSIAKVLQTGDTRCQKEAAYAVTNLTTGGSVVQIIAMFQSAPTILKAFADLLGGSSQQKDEKTILIVMDGLSQILNAASKVGEMDKLTQAMEEFGTIDVIEQLQSHSNDVIYKKALSLIENYFPDDGEDDIEGEEGGENTDPNAFKQNGVNNGSAGVGGEGMKGLNNVQQPQTQAAFNSNQQQFNF